MSVRQLGELVARYGGNVEGRGRVVLLVEVDAAWAPTLGGERVDAFDAVRLALQRVGVPGVIYDGPMGWPLQGGENRPAGLTEGAWPVLVPWMCEAPLRARAAREACGWSNAGNAGHCWSCHAPRPARVDRYRDADGFPTVEAFEAVADGEVQTIAGRIR